MRRCVIGDIHGAWRALRQCLERAHFDRLQDQLIVLGDVCDGWSEVRESIAELLLLSHCTYILGNHDEWAFDWMTRGVKPLMWLAQGGSATIESYDGDRDCVPASHKNLFARAPRYYREANSVGKIQLFVHGGIDWRLSLEDQDPEAFCWDRRLIHESYIRSLDSRSSCHLSEFDEVFVGHSPTQRFHTDLPAHFCNVWGLDTGAGWQGKLTIMDVDTKEYWQSDAVGSLYEGEKGRLQ